jgi:hypothetical protein
LPQAPVFSAASQFLIGVRLEHPADSSSAPVRQFPASTQVDLAPSIRLARPWAAPAVRGALAVGLDLALVLDLADLRVRALVDHARDRAEQRRLLKLDARCALLHAAVRVVSSSIPRPKKDR